MNIIEQLDQISCCVKELQKENSQLNNLKSLLDSSTKLNLYKCVLDDCEVTIKEYALGKSVDDVIASRGWPWDYENTVIAEIMNSEHIKQLLETLCVRTVDEDFD